MLSAGGSRRLCSAVCVSSSTPTPSSEAPRQNRRPLLGDAHPARSPITHISTLSFSSRLSSYHLAAESSCDVMPFSASWHPFTWRARNARVFLIVRGQSDRLIREQDVRVDIELLVSKRDSEDSEEVVLYLQIKRNIIIMPPSLALHNPIRITNSAGKSPLFDLLLIPKTCLFSSRPRGRQVVCKLHPPRTISLDFSPPRLTSQLGVHCVFVCDFGGPRAEPENRKLGVLFWK